MIASAPKLDLRVARTPEDLDGAKRLRYRVFIEELSGTGASSDHEKRLEQDRFDPFCDHLILVDLDRDPATLDHVIGVYRVMRESGAAEVGQFYSESEYDLSVLKASGRPLLELGRSCIDADFRGTMAMHLLWQGLGDYVTRHQIEIMFGVASFHGTSIGPLAEALSFLNGSHLAPAELRVRTVEHAYQSMDLVPQDQFDRKTAVRALPALIKAYIRLGGFVGDGAFVDHDFNTTDVMLIMDTARVTEQAKARYAKSMADTPES